MTSTPWIWTEYYKYISLSGLEEVDCFKVDFESSDKIALFNQYIRAGKIELDR